MVLSARMPDGATRREHLMIAAASGCDIPELEPMPVPRGCIELMEVFWRLRRAAGSNGMGPNAITFEAIHAWQAMNKCPLTPWELETIEQLDAEAMAAVRKANK